MRVYYRGYLIKGNYWEQFGIATCEVYSKSRDTGNWIIVSNVNRTLKEAKAYIREYLR